MRTIENRIRVNLKRFKMNTNRFWQMFGIAAIAIFAFVALYVSNSTGFKTVEGLNQPSIVHAQAVQSVDPTMVSRLVVAQERIAVAEERQADAAEKSNTIWEKIYECICPMFSCKVSSEKTNLVEINTPTATSTMVIATRTPFRTSNTPTNSTATATKPSDPTTTFDPTNTPAPTRTKVSTFAPTNVPSSTSLPTYVPTSVATRTVIPTRIPTFVATSTSVPTWTVCHKSPPAPGKVTWVTLTMHNVHEYEAHKNHGDSDGPCVGK